MTGPVPRRVLLVSAGIGEGHNSAARALEEAIAREWPGSEVRWLDALEAVGHGFARLARRFYVAQVERTPRMYEFFFSAMWRHRWYLEATRKGAGALFGRRMRKPIRDFAPDVILSTYPLGSAGLSWLRARGELGVPAGAWIPAFCPHPSWLYPNLDITYVMHPLAAKLALAVEPGMRVEVGALPVTDAFAPGARGAGPFVALLCAGSLALGRLDRAVTAILEAGPDVRAVVVCGHNDELRVELAARGDPPDRLRVVGWTDDMPGLMRACDVVIGNAGGATALEALASGRRLIMFEPIAGHGKANAELLAEAGLADIAATPDALTAAIRRLADAADQAVAADMAVAAVAADTAASGRGDRRREYDLAALAGR